MASVKNLLESDFVRHYGISSGPTADCVMTDSVLFDLDDSASVVILPVSEGKVSFSNPSSAELEVVSYEGFINQCRRPWRFLDGRKKCDFVLCHADDRGFVVLLEVTSAFMSVGGNTLSEPIKGFQGGKSQKSEVQLLSSLRDLLDVPEIKKVFIAKPHKVCLMAYELKRHTDPEYFVRHPFERYLSVESAETGEDGAVVPNSSMNDLGFEYRRISHNYSFSLGL